VRPEDRWESNLFTRNARGRKTRPKTLRFTNGQANTGETFRVVGQSVELPR
jgi:hypothetical protein